MTMLFRLKYRKSSLWEVNLHPGCSTNVELRRKKHQQQKYDICQGNSIERRYWFIMGFNLHLIIPPQD